MALNGGSSRTDGKVRMKKDVRAVQGAPLRFFRRGALSFLLDALPLVTLAGARHILFQSAVCFPVSFVPAAVAMDRTKSEKCKRNPKWESQSAKRRQAESERRREASRETKWSQEEPRGTERSQEEPRGTERNPRGTERNREEPRGTERNREESKRNPRGIREESERSQTESEGNREESKRNREESKRNPKVVLEIRTGKVTKVPRWVRTVL